MDALIVNRQAVSDGDTAAVSAAVPGFGSGGVHLLTLSGGASGQLEASDGVLNVYTPRGSGSYSRGGIGPSVILFDNAWARAFLRYALSLVEPGGTLTIVRGRSSAKGGRSLLSIAAMSDFLGGGEESMIDNGVALTVARTDTLPAPVRSTLTAFLEEDKELTATLAAYYQEKTVPEELLTALNGISHPSYPIGSVSIDADPSCPGIERLNIHRRLAGSEEGAYAAYVAGTSPYMIDGVRYKHALLGHIIRTCSPELASRPISVVDVGAAYGLLPIELALDDQLQVTSATAVELGFAYAIGAHRLTQHFGELDGIFKFAHAGAETFDFVPPLDVVTFLGSLLYVAKDAVVSTLDGIWAALSPGGLLVIHENIRRPDFNQYDLMFSADELDALMNRYGAIRYFMSTAAVELSKEKAGDKTVFRVVRKDARS